MLLSMSPETIATREVDMMEFHENTAFVDVSGTTRAGNCVGWIVVMGGDERGRDFRLVDGRNLIGTAADCSVLVNDRCVSGRHAVIHASKGECTIVDLDSTNGTLVNNQRVARQTLIDNERIRVGRTLLKFKAVGVDWETL